MTRAEFVAFLARAVADPSINLSEDEAARLLRAFDAGTLPLASLPLPLATAIQPTDDAVRKAAALLIASYLPRKAWRVRGRDKLRASFMLQARRQAAVVVATGDIAAWQTSMRDLVRVHLAAQAQLGAAGALSAATVARLDADARTQGAYLSRMSDAMAAASLLGSAWGVGQVASRAAGYAGGPWGWFFKGQESVNPPETMYEYVAVDDGRTCDACSEAADNGPYAADEGPMPGEVCLGGGRCRCERVEIEGKRGR